MSTAASTPAPTPVVLDTGVLVSLAVSNPMTGAIKQRWQQRGQTVILPAAVLTELQAAAQPTYSGSIPKHLAGSAVKKAIYLAEMATSPTPAELIAANTFHAYLATGPDDGAHRGESEAAALASTRNAALMIEDLSARRVLAAHVPCFGLWELLHAGLHDGSFQATAVDQFVTQMLAAGRPNFHGASAAQIEAEPIQPGL